MPHIGTPSIPHPSPALLAALIGVAVGLCAAAPADETAVQLSSPLPIHDGGQPIDVPAGHLAPLYTDFDGDGLKDLLLGQLQDGKLRYYRNIGTATAPRFNGYEWIRLGGEAPGEARVPSG